ncbi:histidine--tRNA ligase [Phormidium sp. FACHB-592]|uniref:Histidine--tRNA ligase n=1 Tax=Stenomitos frigidus AS-A4 TaxID=2933935 RepID=A0ABV0KLY6_9CYAN|nr:histidine--tRNA ligase [Phormidium sp. FACHB-592]MBD2072621.1 histidine--tRNA ligase [Phormidium sp. FACHB-592]
MGLIQAQRGTRDILPGEIAYWQQVEATARAILHQAAFEEIRTPIFEQTDLFERGIGEATDVVGKEMYTFQDKGDRSLTLRPEGTAGVVRAFIEHGLHAQGGVQRLWYMGPMFRYERPGTGRQRQFHQLGVELLGSGNVRADAEVIAIAVDLLQAVGLNDLQLELNSLGTRDDRIQYRSLLVDYLTPYKADLDPDSQDRLTRNPLRILDSKDAKTQAILQEAPLLGHSLSVASQERFAKVQQLLTNLGIGYTLNPKLVRGLDYYSHTAFEFQSKQFGTVGGGGRYDGLIAELGGPETLAIGWAIGLERLIGLLQQLAPSQPTAIDFYIVSRGEAAEAQALKLAQTLRHAGFVTELDLSSSAFGKQFKRADRSGAAACFILGDAEAANQTVQLKWLATGEQQAIAQADLPALADTLHEQIARSRNDRSTTTV